MAGPGLPWRISRMSATDFPETADAVRVLLPRHLDEALMPTLGVRPRGLEGASMGTSWRVLWLADRVAGQAASEQEVAVRAAVQAELVPASGS